MAEQELRIVGVELAEESMRSYRRLRDLDLVAYPVIVHLSHPVSPFEAKLLRARLGIIVDEDDEMTALLPATALDALGTQIGQLNRTISEVATEARQLAAACYEEDHRLRELAKDINARLKG